MKTLLAISLSMLAAASGICQAQAIDSRDSQSFALSTTQANTTGPLMAELKQPVMSTIMTRAIAHRDADGKLTVKCQVEESPIADAPRTPNSNARRRK